MPAASTAVLLPAAVTASGLTGLAGWTVSVVTALGPLGVGLLVAAENLFPPIPSEVILPVAGFVAADGGMNVVAAVVAATVGSVVGALALYGLGAWLGRDRLRAVVRRMPLMELADVDRAERWFERFGPWAVLVGRCVPVVRSLISVPAGLQRMPLRSFLPLTFLGSAAWNSIFVGAGYVLGSRWQDVGAYSSVLNNAAIAVIAVLLVIFVVTRLRRRRVVSA